MTPNPLIQIRELDFSEFHPFDHTLAESYCPSLPGGRRRHLALWWEYKASERLLSLLHRPLCAMRRHEESAVWVGGPHVAEDAGPSYYDCRWCACLLPVPLDTNSSA